MKKTTGILILFFLIVSDYAMGQVLTISPLNPSPSSLSILTPVGAGTKPADPLINYQGQSITYEFPTGWGNVGYVDVNSTNIPLGLSFIIQAAAGLGGTEGIALGPVTVSPTYTSIINQIAKVKKPITRVLTQNMIISNFSQLHPGQYNVTINLWLH